MEGIEWRYIRYITLLAEKINMSVCMHSETSEKECDLIAFDNYLVTFSFNEIDKKIRI